MYIEVYNGNEDITITELVLYFKSKMNDKDIVNRYTENVSIQPLSGTTILVKVFNDKVEQWGPVSAKGY